MSKLNLLRKVLSVLFLGLFLLGCKPARIRKEVTRQLENPFYNNQFTGLLVVNPKTKDTVFSYNADRYFTPASNTKLFTLYTALKFLPDSIPAFKYSVIKDTLHLLGTGNPAFLHPYFQDSTALKFAGKYKNVNVILNNLDDDKYGPGWAWEDYDRYFSPERSSFPVYGNVLSISNTNNSLQTTPAVFKENVQVLQHSSQRAYNNNTFYYNPKRRDTIEVPMVLNPAVFDSLWQNILPGKVKITNYKGQKMDEVAYGMPSDTLYKRMMLVSDNFLAEQILILSASTLSDTLSSKKIRANVLETYLKDLKQKPRWVDGSGLSRYNLFTPLSFVQVLSKLYADIPEDRLFNLFPVGGQSGTLKHYYSGKDRPYIYAKSGTVGNNYALSGYLLTNSGETLIFSFMNNHYTTSTKAVKQHMTQVFEWLRDNY
ncbi:D-alanyl-D-alanine carboxypeptidase/D-alanyl-D-alanine-endopeptidase [Formosa sp. S-31]|uniref:D-alanyl-D-alanine carboxypeptidase/D-alanyl-D-alanine-endopeptidase n=1 Tax=Formosa sp. S-31 TaxID=2790949 RepID=UPI003EBEB57A